MITANLLKAAVTIIFLLTAGAIASADTIQNNYSAGTTYPLSSNISSFQRIGQKLTVDSFNISDLGFYVTQGNNTNYIENITLQNFTHSQNNKNGSNTAVDNFYNDPLTVSYCQKFNNLGDVFISNVSFFSHFFGDEYSIFYSLRNASTDALFYRVFIEEVTGIGDDFYQLDYFINLNGSGSNPNKPLISSDFYFCIEYENMTGTSWHTGSTNSDGDISGEYCKKVDGGAYSCGGDDLYIKLDYLQEQPVDNSYYEAFNASGLLNFSIRYESNDTILATYLWGNASALPLLNTEPNLQYINFNTSFFLNDTYYFSVDYNGTGLLKVFAGGALSGENQATYNETDVSWEDKSNDLAYWINGTSIYDICDPAHRYLCVEANCTSDGLGYWYSNYCNENPQSVASPGGGGSSSPEEETSAAPLCDGLTEPLKDAFEIFWRSLLQVRLTGQEFRNLWVTFTDALFCGSAASIAPIN